MQRILWLNHCGTLCSVKPISYPVLQAVRVNQCHCPLVQSRQRLQNVAAGACYYGDGVIINFKPPWQTVCHIKQERLPRMPLTHLTFQSEPQSLSLQPAALSFSLCGYIHLSLAFHCSNSRLPLFEHLSSHFLTLSVHRHFVSPLSRLFKHSSGEFQST